MLKADYALGFYLVLYVYIILLNSAETFFNVQT